MRHRFPGPVSLFGLSRHYVHGKVWEITINLGDTLPLASESYTFAIEYDDGTTEKITTPSPTILNEFAIPIAPVGEVTNQDALTFSWQAPQNLPVDTFDTASSLFPNTLSHLYRIIVLGETTRIGGPVDQSLIGEPKLTGGRADGAWWVSPVMPPSTLSCEYNFLGYPRRRWATEHPTDSGKPFTTGSAFVWQIELRDAYGNKAIYESQFTPTRQ